MTTATGSTQMICRACSTQDSRPRGSAWVLASASRSLSGSRATTAVTSPSSRARRAAPPSPFASRGSHPSRREEDGRYEGPFEHPGPQPAASPPLVSLVAVNCEEHLPQLAAL